ncbi:hypothetical protein IDM32_20010 [Acinetobacter seifertii]|nr:hypothetical protein [Acinetobacter seifertii]
MDANRHSVTYQWDKQGRIQKLINQNQAEYLFEYNQYGQLIREQSFDGEVKYFNYNQNGFLSEIIRPNNKVTLTYFEDGQISSKFFNI